MTTLHPNPVVRIVDDDEIHGDALQFMLQSEGWEVRTYASCRDFLLRDDLETPGCIVLDYQMPDILGTEAQELLLARGCERPILFLTAHADLDMAIRVFKKGANDLLKKPVDADEFLKAIASAVERDLEHFRRADPEYVWRERFASLSPRERQVLRLVAMGLMNCQVAARLGLSERTIEVHRANGYRRLGIKTLGELMRFLEHVPQEGR